MQPSQAEIERYESVMAGYYKNPAPEEAAHALGFLLRYTNCWQQDSPSAPQMMYLFCRIAQLSPPAKEAYQQLCAGLNEEQGKFVMRILAALQANNLPNPLSKVPQDPAHLDWCWAEFLVTGELDAVRHIVKTLDQNDTIRESLEAWYSANTQQTGALGYLKQLLGANPTTTALKALAEVGIAFEKETGKLKNQEDMDCYCVHLAEKKIPIFKILPFQLPQDLLLRAVSKGSALWSLQSNAQQHERVAQCCKEEAQKPGGKARLLLTEPPRAYPKSYSP